MGVSVVLVDKRALFLSVVSLALWVAPAVQAEAHEAAKYVVMCIQPDTLADCEKGTKALYSLYKKAYRGDYQARRNLAYSLQIGSFPARKDPVAACTWRLIIIASGSTKVDDSDFANMNLICGRLSQPDLGQAKAEAVTLTRRMVMKEKIDESIVKADPTLDSTAHPL
jgi:hypothetical protein